MKERSILFNAPMVRALLDDSKTQTRRIAKLTDAGHVKEPGGHRRWHPSDPNARLACPYGQPGDRLKCYHCGHEQNTLETSPDFRGSERRLHGRVGWSNLQPHEVQGVRPQGVGGLVSTEGPCHVQGVSDDFDVPREQEGHEVSTPLDLHRLSRGTADADIGGSSQGRGLQQQQTGQSLLGHGSRELAGQEGPWQSDSGRETSGVEVLGPGTRAHPLGGAARPVQPKACGTCARCGLVLYPGDSVGGSRLWVRETWAAPHAFDHLPPRLIPAGTRFHYRASEDAGGLLWRPSIHMPRWASRITLEITAVRIERLQDISEEDAIAEGIFRLEYGGQISWRDYSLDDEWAEVSPMLENPVDSYRTLWDSINGTGSWAANPLVWAVEFKKVTP